MAFLPQRRAGAECRGDRAGTTAKADGNASAAGEFVFHREAENWKHLVEAGRAASHVLDTNEVKARVVEGNVLREIICDGIEVAVVESGSADAGDAVHGD